jgi:NAD(P)-dependent dehydrogenase (short-subunit alcohol dehydrogenase family)
MKDQHYSRTIIGKKIVIIGADSEIGLATVALATDEGAHVIAVFQAGKVIEKEYMVLPYGSSTYVTDLNDEKSFKRLFNDAGNLDHLVYIGSNNACTAVMPKFSLESDMGHLEHWPKSLITAIKYAAPTIRAGGSISISIAEAFALHDRMGRSDSCSRESLAHFTRTMAVCLAPVRVNCVTSVPTASIFNIKQPDVKLQTIKEISKKTLVGRVGVPEDEALALVYLMKQQFATGQNLIVDGGYRQ